MSKSSKRGMSLEEKREKMLEIFYETRSFYQLKDLEKLGPKRGVISQSVKDVIQNLVDDDLVFKDKIGTSVYFWSLPSLAGNQLRHSHAKLVEDLETAETERMKLQNKREMCMTGRQESEERNAALNSLKLLQAESQALQEELDLYEGNDPQVFESKKNSTRLAHDAVNRWTDNVFILQQWCSNTFPEAKERLLELYSEVGIDDDFDLLDT